MEIDPITGLPKDLVNFEEISKESQDIRVYNEKRKFGKVYTLISGINPNEVNAKDLLKALKNKLACGGAAKKSIIELQGNHKKKVKDILVKEGFPAENIVVE